MHLHTGTHAVQQLLGMQVNMDTIFTTWLTALIVFLVVFAASRGKKLVPTGVQNCVEILVEGLLSQFEKNVGPKYRQVVPALLTLFLFILTANQLGLLPTEHLTASPTSDINTTLAWRLRSRSSFTSCLLPIKALGNGSSTSLNRSPYSSSSIW